MQNRNTRREIKQTLEILCQAHEEIQSLCDQGNTRAAVSVMADCQDCAISLGTFIDQNEGEGTDEVALLESYCELLYRINIALMGEDIVYTDGDGETTQTGSMDMGSGEAEADDVACKDCDESVSYANDADHTESVNATDDADYMKQLNAAIAPLEPLTQIVFMPCEAELWGCMEALWRQAMEDPSCEVYVVPLPFYVNTPQGQSIKLCYRQEHFPSYVKITPYTEYSLETERPDKIYIHKAFDDDSTQVVNVEEKYYSWNLKSFTDELVYVCYLIRDENRGLPLDHRDLSAYQYVDKILVGNERMKEDFLTFARLNKEKVSVSNLPIWNDSRNYSNIEISYEQRTQLEKQHLIHDETEIEEPTVPYEWKERMKGRKVVFYHGSVEKLVVPDRKSLNKTKSVLESFVGKDDLLLIWRPYPLTQGVLMCIDPEAAKEYGEIRKWFIDNQIGILDETIDYYNYLNKVDAYIGEKWTYSFELIQGMKIPTMIIDEDVSYDFVKEKDYRVQISEVFYEEKKIWFIADPYGLLCEMNLISGHVSVLAKLTKSENVSSGYHQYVGILKKENKLYLAPHWAEEILTYDLEKGILHGISFEKTDEHNMSYNGVINFENGVYFIPKQNDTLMRIEANTEELKTYDSCIKQVIDQAVKDEHEMQKNFMLAYEVEGQTLRLISSLDDIILEFNLRTEKYIIRRIGIEGYKTFSYFKHGGVLYLFPYMGIRIILWNQNTGIYKYAEEYTTSENYKDINSYIPFCGGAINKGKILCFPKEKRPILTLDIEGRILDVQEDNIFQMKVTSDEEYNISMNINYHLIKKIEDTGFLTFRMIDNTFFWSMSEDSDIRRIPCRIPDDEIEKVLVQRIAWMLNAHNMILQETREFTISSFLLYARSLKGQEE
jgi:hypothetical protein